MSYELNAFFQFDNENRSHSRVLVYPDQDTAAKLLNRMKERGAAEISVAECIPESASRLPMPHVLMENIDHAIRSRGGYFVVVGLDVYLALLEEENIDVFMTELRRRLDKDSFHVDYLLSGNHHLPFVSRYEEARKVIFLNGTEETPELFHVWAYHSQWAKSDSCIGFNALVRRVEPFHPAGEYTVFLPDMLSGQAGLGKAVTFVTNIRDIAIQLYGFDIHLDNIVLERLLLDSVRCGQTPNAFLSKRVGEEYCNPRLALNRLLALRQDDLWPAYVWHVKKSLPEQSYLAKVLSEDAEKLLWNYAVGTALSVLSDRNAAKFAFERAEGLKAAADSTEIEPLVMEFIAAAKERGDALQFLNCGTFSEKVEMIRRAGKEELSRELPRLYGELYPMLADYLSPYDWGNHTVTAYFREYRRLKLSDTLTDAFASLAYETHVPDGVPTRDSLLEPLRQQTDTALLVVDALGIEYLPVLTAMAKRCGLNFEPPRIALANIPTETEFNSIRWETERTLAPVKGVDNIVHDGAVKHEAASPECCFASTLNTIKTDVLNRIVDGLTRFSRVVVTADHGSSRLAVIASQDGKGKTLPWSQKPGEGPLDWRYSTTREGVQRPEECESQYFPDSGKTYWVVRGYHRLPKKGGKKYALHGGASLEERLVPVLIFTKNNDAATASVKQPAKKQTAELKDEFEGLI